MKAQFTLEFVFAIGVGMIVSMLIIVAVSGQFEDIRRDKNVFLINDLAKSIRYEVFIAAESSDGYSRTFTVPYNLSETSYVVSINSTSVIVHTTEYESVLKVPSVTGNINKGTNTIRKEGGIIYLN